MVILKDYNFILCSCPFEMYSPYKMSKEMHHFNTCHCCSQEGRNHLSKCTNGSSSTNLLCLLLMEKE